MLWIWFPTRISQPDDWEEIETGVWRIRIPRIIGDEWVLCDAHMFGNRQCEICGQPIEATEDESQKCNHCIFAVARYRQGYKMDPRVRKRIQQWAKETGQEWAK